MPNALLLSRDAEVVRVVRRVLEGLATPLEVTANSDQAAQSIKSKKFDAVMVDVDDIENGTTVLSGLRAGKSNNKSIAFAVVNGTTSVKTAYELGANFVISKPVSIERVTRCFRAAYGLILRERRRYQRHRVSAPAQVLTSKGYVAVQILDVSEGGASLSFPVRNNVSGEAGMVTLLFQLNNMPKTIEAKGELLWTEDSGRAGFRIIAMAPEPRRIFDEWLAEQSSGGEEAFATIVREEPPRIPMPPLPPFRK